MVKLNKYCIFFNYAFSVYLELLDGDTSLTVEVNILSYKKACLEIQAYRICKNKTKQNHTLIDNN